MKTSLKSDIADYIRVSYPEYRNIEAIEKFTQLQRKADDGKYDAGTGTRRARELSENKLDGPLPMLLRDPKSKYTRYQFNVKDYPLNLGTHFSRHNKVLRSKFKQPSLWACD